MKKYIMSVGLIAVLSGCTFPVPDQAEFERRATVTKRTYNKNWEFLAACLMQRGGNGEMLTLPHSAIYGIRGIAIATLYDAGSNKTRVEIKTIETGKAYAADQYLAALDYCAN